VVWLSDLIWLRVRRPATTNNNKLFDQQQLSGEIGASMETRYKETALGGLAATKTGQAIAKKVLIRDIEILPDENV